ncbi:MAG: PTS system mannose/fructose/sorbose family transporter subunit IID [Desulfomonile sp.]|nr:PTS system mannose/fructose/sorbose family transporter subunit IID [Desulfomonile sp.]
MNGDGVEGRVFRRSFFIETLWNYQKMQNVGFAYAISPALLFIHKNPEARAQAISRQLEYINTHPVMSPLLVGLVARLEQDLEPAAGVRYRRSAMSAAAAYGDRVFWGGIKPLAAIWGTLVALCFSGSVVGGLVLLLVYNLPQVFVRRLGFRLGWTRGLDALQVLGAPRTEHLVRLLRGCFCLALGMTAAAAVLTSATGSATLGLWGPALLGIPVIGVGGYFFRRKGVSSTLVIYIAILLAVMVCILIDSGT